MRVTLEPKLKGAGKALEERLAVSLLWMGLDEFSTREEGSSPVVFHFPSFHEAWSLSCQPQGEQELCWACLVMGM